jgi:hypothetical protein
MSVISLEQWGCWQAVMFGFVVSHPVARKRRQDGARRVGREARERWRTRNASALMRAS